MSAFSARVGALWKQGWMEIPEIMATSGLALVGIGLAVGSIWAGNRREGTWDKKYKAKPMILRPDDPRVARIKKTSGLDD